MTTIYFVRHANPDLRNKTDFRQLSQKGILDSMKLVKPLSRLGIDVILSSPFERAVQTIKPFSETMKKEIILIDGFKERVVGTWVDDFDAFAKMQWDDFEYKLPLGESLKESQDRNVDALKEVLLTYKDKTICIGTHGTALSLILNHFDKSFGFDQFMEIVHKMPMVLKMIFDNDTLVSVEEIKML